MGFIRVTSLNVTHITICLRRHHIGPWHLPSRMNPFQASGRKVCLEWLRKLDLMKWPDFIPLTVKWSYVWTPVAESLTCHEWHRIKIKEKKRWGGSNWLSHFSGLPDVWNTTVTTPFQCVCVCKHSERMFKLGIDGQNKRQLPKQWRNKPWGSMN